MNDDKRTLQGSKSRDIFKRCHKEKTHYLNYACDLDFVLIEKRGKKANEVKAHIVAFLDYKKEGDAITFAEGIAYNRLMEIAPIYVVMGNNPEDGPFTIKRVISVNWFPEPPIVTYGEEVTVKDWTAFHSWESKLREKSWER